MARGRFALAVSMSAVLLWYCGIAGLPLPASANSAASAASASSPATASAYPTASASSAATEITGLAPGDPYYAPITACAELGIIEDDDDGGLRLEKSLDRYQVTHIVASALRALGVALPAPATVRWSDIPPGHWAYDDVSVCSQLGLLGGYDDLSFRGRSSMQKEHWLALASELAVHFAPSPQDSAAQTPPDFTDLPDINWLWQPIKTLARYGWLDPDTMADDFLNRNDVATARLVYWYLGKLIIARNGSTSAAGREGVLAGAADKGEKGEGGES